MSRDSIVIPLRQPEAIDDPLSVFFEQPANALEVVRQRLGMIPSAGIGGEDRGLDAES